MANRLKHDRQAFPHWCADGHLKIGHADSENELCPLCAVIAQRDALAAELAQAKARVIELSEMRPAMLKQRVQDLEAALREVRTCAFSPRPTDLWARIDALLGQEPPVAHSKSQQKRFDALTHERLQIEQGIRSGSATDPSAQEKDAK